MAGKRTAPKLKSPILAGRASIPESLYPNSAPLYVPNVDFTAMDYKYTYEEPRNSETSQDPQSILFHVYCSFLGSRPDLHNVCKGTEGPFWSSAPGPLYLPTIDLL